MTIEFPTSGAMVASTIRILTPSKFPPDQAIAVGEALREQFHVEIQRKEYVFALERALDRSRGQYLSAALLRQMCIDHPPTDDCKLLAITNVDLYAPVLTFVFGEAQLSGTCAILSTFRLRNEFYGIPGDGQILRERVLKEAVHEVGHLFGLIHCHAFDCVMRSSTYVEEIDLKSRHICAGCRENLKSAEFLNNDTLSGMRSEKNNRSHLR